MTHEGRAAEVTRPEAYQGSEVTDMGWDEKKLYLAKVTRSAKFFLLSEEGLASVRLEARSQLDQHEVETDISLTEVPDESALCAIILDLEGQAWEGPFVPDHGNISPGEALKKIEEAKASPGKKRERLEAKSVVEQTWAVEAYTENGMEFIELLAGKFSPKAIKARGLTWYRFRVEGDKAIYRPGI